MIRNGKWSKLLLSIALAFKWHSHSPFTGFVIIIMSRGCEVGNGGGGAGWNQMNVLLLEKYGGLVGTPGHRQQQLHGT